VDLGAVGDFFIQRVDQDLAIDRNRRAVGEMRAYARIPLVEYADELAHGRRIDRE